MSSAWICNECLDVCHSILDEDKKHPEGSGKYRVSSPAGSAKKPVAKPLVCNFCHRSQDVVDKLISSPAVRRPRYICDRCVGEYDSELATQNPPEKYSLLKRLIRNVTGRTRHFNTAVAQHR